MSDDKSKQGYQDDSKIAIDELEYWTKKWGVTKDQILNAFVKTNSRAVSKIEKYLREKGVIEDEGSEIV